MTPSWTNYPSSGSPPSTSFFATDSTISALSYFMSLLPAGSGWPLWGQKLLTWPKIWHMVGKWGIELSDRRRIQGPGRGDMWGGIFPLDLFPYCPCPGLPLSSVYSLPVFVALELNSSRLHAWGPLNLKELMGSWGHLQTLAPMQISLGRVVMCSLLYRCAAVLQEGKDSIMTEH